VRSTCSWRRKNAILQRYLQVWRGRPQRRTAARLRRWSRGSVRRRGPRRIRGLGAPARPLDVSANRLWRSCSPLGYGTTKGGDEQRARAPL